MSNPIVPTPDSADNIKRCNRCGEIKPLSAFSADRKKKDGLNTYCRACKAEQHAAYSAKHHTDVLKRKAEYRRHNRDKINGYAAQYRKKNAKRILEKHRKYNNTNSEQLKKYRQTSVGQMKGKVNGQRRAARTRGLENTLTAADWQAALDYFGGRCAVCGRPQGLWHTLSADHWIPISKGGPTTPDNIVPLCHGVGGCNNSKNNRDASEWLIAKFGKRKGRAIQRRIEAYLDTCKPDQEQVG